MQASASSMEVPSPCLCAAPAHTGVTAALLLPSFPGSSLLAIATAAGAPYLQTRIWAAWAGWASLSLAAKIGAGLSGGMGKQHVIMIPLVFALAGP
jgi:hypothetical protein